MTIDQLLNQTPAKIRAEYRRLYALQFGGSPFYANDLRRLQAALSVVAEIRKFGV